MLTARETISNTEWKRYNIIVGMPDFFFFVCLLVCFWTDLTGPLIQRGIQQQTFCTKLTSNIEIGRVAFFFFSNEKML